MNPNEMYTAAYVLQSIVAICSIGFFTDRLNSRQKKATGVVVNYKGFDYLCLVESLETSCTKEMPLCTTLYSKNSFFIFGDYADQNKWFIYDFGLLYWLKTDKNVSPIPVRYQLKSVLRIPTEK